MARSRRSSRIPQGLRGTAREQLRMIREESSTETTATPTNRPNVSNQELLQELRQERADRKANGKAERRNARNNAYALRMEEGPRTKIEYSGFNPGDLVTITKRAFNRYGLGNMQLFEGATGVIVEEDDMQLWNNEIEKGRWVQVMGPNGLQRWDIRWCTHIDDVSYDEDED